MLDNEHPHSCEPAAERLGRLRILSVSLAGALLWAGCGDPAVPAAPRAPERSSDTAALVAGPGAPAHDIYRTNGFTCEACHPCGKRIPGGHGQAWMDPASPGFHAIAANQSLSSCASCHGAALDGVGGTVAVSCAQCHGASWKTSCTMCHGGVDGTTGAPPRATWGNDADTVRIGAHTAHVAASHALAQPVACAACHVVPQNALSPGHVNGTVATLTFTGLASQGVPAPGPTWTRAQATCASTYCHGATLSGGNATTPTWTRLDGSQRACGACHGAPPPPPHTTSTACGSCHPGYTQVSVNPATHVNGTVEASSSSHPAGWSSPAQHGVQANLTGLAGCGACHGDLGPTSSCGTCHANAGFASWDTTCTFCHGSTATGRANPPVDIQGRTVATNVSVGVHEAHVTTAIAAPLACTECHPARTGSVRTDAAHVDGNGIAEVAFGPRARTGGAAATYTRTSATSATCASTYCHGRFSGGVSSGSGATMSWTSTAQVTCTSCHGNPPSSGEHSKHVNDKRVACYNCHNAVVSSSNGFVNASLHVNGADNVSFGGTWSSRTVTGTWNPTSRSCSNLACHGSETW